MMYMLLGGAMLLIALLIVLLGIKFLLGGSWFAGWLKGNLVLLITALGLGLGWGALDLFSYQPFKYNDQVASVDFIKQGDNEYRISLIQPNAKLFSKVIVGDKWQLSVRLLKVSPQLLAFGMEPGFRFDELFIQQGSEPSTYPVRASEYGFDLWSLLDKLKWIEPIIITAHEMSEWLEVTDKASFSVVMTSKGLKIVPVE